MIYIISPCRACMRMPAMLLFLLLFSAFIFSAKGQGMTMKKGEAATCMVTLNSSGAADATKTIGIGKSSPSNRVLKVIPNQVGIFNEVAGINPMDKVLLQIEYPMGKPGQQVVVTVQDGGLLDNGKGVKLIRLDNQRKCVFQFKLAADAGLYRLIVRKGNDTKVLQLWVGAQPAAPNN